MTGILAYGGYVPRRRLQRSAIADANAWLNPALKGLAKGERAVANWDEDAVTMAVDASRDCLVGQDRSAIGSVHLASTSLPFSDRQNSGIMKEALNLPDSLSSVDVTGSQRAGTSGLLQALHSARGSRQTVLLAAAEKRLAKPGSDAEMHNGDGAAALLVGDGPVIAELLGYSCIALDFVDHYRGASAEFDYSWETRWIRDEGYQKIVPAALKAAFAKLDFKPADVDHFILPCVFGGIRENIARQIGVPPAAVCDPLYTKMGEAGCAHALVMFVDALQKAKPGDRILVVGFGQGCDVLAFQVTAAIEELPPRNGIQGWLSCRKEERNYVKFLFANGLIDMEKGIRAEADRQTALTVLYRNRKAVLGLVGGRCTKTGTVQFPRSEISVNPEDHAVGTQEDYPLADIPARVMTFTADSLTYSPDPPSYYGMIQFEGGGRMQAEFTDVDPEQLEVDFPVRMVFRIKAVDELRGFTKYFWKAAPAALGFGRKG